MSRVGPNSRLCREACQYVGINTGSSDIWYGEFVSIPRIEIFHPRIITSSHPRILVSSHRVSEFQ